MEKSTPFKNSGKLIVLCGTDGSGKATQTRLLIEKLRLSKIKVETTDFPQYGNPSAAMVEQYLNGKFGSAEEVGPYKASIFYAIDRYAASFQMKKWLEEGKTIVSNRYVSANLGHQGGKISDPEERKIFMEWVLDLEFNIFGIPKPDVNIFLHVPSDLAQSLVDKKRKREYLGEKKRDIHEDDLSHLKNAEQVYLQLCETDPSWIMIECASNNIMLSKDKIAAQVWKEVSSRLKIV